MSQPRRVIFVTSKTRLDDLMSRHHTREQAAFYVSSLGADFSDYENEHAAYQKNSLVCLEALQTWGRYQQIDRAYLTNFIFADDDIVVVLGRDGLVANTLKYLDGQALIGINPDPKRWEGVLLPYEAEALGSLLPAVAADKHELKSVVMAKAKLTDGQSIVGVNDLFIGARTHASALYDISFQGAVEHHSSSGVIVSTGLGSTAWLKSIVSGSVGIANSLGVLSQQTGKHTRKSNAWAPTPWDARKLLFAVREPYVSKTTSGSLVCGSVDEQSPLSLLSRMPDNGVIFSDGMESDYLRFTAGMEATISLSERQGLLVA